MTKANAYHNLTVTRSDGTIWVINRFGAKVILTALRYLAMGCRSVPTHGKLGWEAETMAELLDKLVNAPARQAGVISQGRGGVK